MGGNFPRYVRALPLPRPPTCWLLSAGPVRLQLFIGDPEHTRYLVKYRHVDAKLVLKVTDDKVCLKYRTDQSQDVKKMTGMCHVACGVKS